MPVSISRLRIWFAVMALLLVAVVAGYYLFARYQQVIALRNLPARMGINIQQSSEGFTFSKSEGGRTVFTIHAGNATQFKQGGKAELHQVNIVVYGRDSNRFDQIYGDDFEYDPKSGDVKAQGEVHIDLEGNTGGKTLEDQAPPSEMQNPIHMRAEGMLFNQKSGMAQSAGVVEFRVPHASGRARGVSYDSKKNELQMLSEVQLHTEGSEPTTVLAASGAFTKQPRVLTLQTVELDSGTRKLWAEHATAELSADNAIQKIFASGNVHMQDEGGMEVRAPQAEMRLGDGNTVESARFFGGVDFANSEQGAAGHSGQLLMHFESKAAPDGQKSPQELRTVDAIQQVTLRQSAKGGHANAQSSNSQGSNSQSYVLSSEAMTLELTGGKQLSSARTHGPGELVISPENPRGAAGNKGERTVVTAALFAAGFNERTRLRAVQGDGNVRSVSQIPGQPDKVGTSEAMEARFTPEGALASVEQVGNFQYAEAESSPNEPGGRHGSSARASFNPADDSITLLGSPRVVDGGVTVTAETIRLTRRSSEAVAQGNVKTTYSELKVQPGGALLATADPVHVTAQTMNAAQLTGVAHYSGGARLWQGSNIVEGRTIDFDQHARSIVATGERRHPVSSVFVQVDAKGRSSTVVVTAPRLTYADNEREARYSGGVTVRAESGVMTADHAEVFLNAAGASHAVAAPSQLDHIVAGAHVVVQQQERRAEGDKLVYTAADSRFVMTGGPPVMSDPVNGTVRGNSLTFFSRDDRVIVEGDGGSRTVTHTHVSR